MKKVDKKIIGAAVIIPMLVIIEWKKGYYMCPECSYKFKPNFKEYILAPHFFTSRYYNCPHCNHRHLFIKDWNNNLSISACEK